MTLTVPPFGMSSGVISLQLAPLSRETWTRPSSLPRPEQSRRVWRLLEGEHGVVDLDARRVVVDRAARVVLLLLIIGREVGG